MNAQNYLLPGTLRESRHVEAFKSGFVSQFIAGFDRKSERKQSFSEKNFK
jgi:hypothetical protein